MYVEWVDPDTGAPLPDGEVGELVLTTLRKRALHPLPHARPHAHHPGRLQGAASAIATRASSTLTSRTDDMFKVKGCNIFPLRWGSHRRHRRHVQPRVPGG